MKKLVLLLAFFAFIGMEVLYAQTRTITGKVINAEDGSSIPGVSVSVKGTTLGIITDMEGQYTLKVPESAEALIFSFVGMRTQEVPITSDRIDIQMEPDVVGVDEVVVVAYGTQRKEAKTGAVDVVSSSQLEDVPVSSAEKLLQGKVAGVQINSGSGLPGSGTQLRIRGYSSINAGKEPLYVIDGVPVVNGDYSLTNNTNNVLASLNPNNIESITVLKDAAAASIYGSRAANGVVLITTKTGKAGRTVFKLNAQYGFSQKTNDSNFRFMNPEEIWTYMRDAVRNIGQDPDNPALANSNLYFPKSLLGGELTNWWNEVFRTGINQKYELSASGGDEKTRFRISGEYYNTQGIQIGSGMERISMQINLDHKISEKATIGLRSFGAYKYVKDQANDLAYANPFWAASSLLPWENAYNPDGTFNWDLPSNNNSNPLGNVALNQQWNKDHHYFASLYFTYQIIPGLEFKTQNSHDYLTNQGRIYWNPETPDGENYDGYVYEAVNQNRTLTTTNTLRYNNVFGEKHSVDALVGYEVTDNKYYAYTMEGGGASADLPYLSNVSKDKDIGYSLSSWAFQSFIGKLDYNFDQRYFLSLSARRDGSSRFGENNRWATFWSVGGSWNAHNEGFMDGLSWVNVAKLRGSYGISGNAAIGNYESYGVYGSRTYNGLGGLAPNQLANPDLTWEDNTSMNIGLDLTLFERFNATVDYYDRKTSNMLLSVPLSRTTGFTSISQNVGSLTNKGLEVAADYDVVKAPFKWNLGFNISFNKVQITDLAGQEEIADGWWRRYRVGGKGFSEYYVYDYAGVNPVDGNALWYDEAGKITENAADARRVYKGKVDPDFFGGFTSSFSWKGFTVDAYFNFSYGNSVYIMERRYIDSDGYNWGSIQSANLLPYWREPGDLVPNPKPIPNNTSDSNAWGTSRFLEDGSFLRFKSLTVSYNIPKEWVAKAKLNSARIYMNAVNLYAWDDVSYWDPERDVTGGGYATYPNPRTITFGVDLGF